MDILGIGWGVIVLFSRRGLYQGEFCGLPPSRLRRATSLDEGGYTPHPPCLWQATFFLRKRAPFCRLRDISPDRGITQRASRVNSFRHGFAVPPSRLPARSALLPCGFIMPSEIWSFYSLPFALLPISSPQRLASSSTGRASVLRPPETRAPKGGGYKRAETRALGGGYARGEIAKIKKRHGCIRTLRDCL